jgi:hypothetical protein
LVGAARAAPPTVTPSPTSASTTAPSTSTPRLGGVAATRPRLPIRKSSGPNRQLFGHQSPGIAALQYAN